MANLEVDVEDIDILLIGSEDEISEAVRQIHCKFKKHIVSVIRKRAPSAKPYDVEDIYQDVMVSILETARSGKYDPDATTLTGFIYTIAYRRAIDWLRKIGRNKEETNSDLLIASVQEAISRSTFSENWEQKGKDGKRNKLLAEIRNLIPKLKLRQRQVAEAIYESFPDLLSDSDIKNLIYQRHKDDVTVIAVKRARQEVYKKLRELLQ